ncbi:Prickle [Operophtera brumata]|uniref:Prickle n=1 Tax=Operophtera brumata TaxID=104452 RepID=A0A0L7LM11_OPEBR|nr:Prickle [Operophtera brumata]
MTPVCRNCVVSPTTSSPPPLHENASSPPPPAPSSPHSRQSISSPPPHSPQPSSSSIPSQSGSPHPYSYQNFRRSQPVPQNYPDFNLLHSHSVSQLNQGQSTSYPQSPQSAMSLSPHPVPQGKFRGFLEHAERLMKPADPHRHSQSDDDSGCALEEKKYLKNMEWMKLTFAQQPELLPFLDMIGCKRPVLVSARYCHALSDEERKELREFSIQRKREALGRGQVRQLHAPAPCERHRHVFCPCNRKRCMPGTTRRVPRLQTSLTRLLSFDK